jgi:hypothetical protein
MTKEEIFSIWAPDASPWSPWAKPVVFAFLDTPLSHLAATGIAPEIGWAPPPEEKVALVLDLPGAEGAMAGLALAARGYRPVPLYNAVPLPWVEALVDPTTGRPVAAVNVMPIISALRDGAETLAQLSLPADAPPAFLLDADRSGDGRKMLPDEFDNRSISFTTDFPSANFFAAYGIERVMLVQRGRFDPQPDLAHSLRRWQDAGFVLETKQIDSPLPPQRFEVPRPSWYGMMFQRMLSTIGLKRSPVGGFGAWMVSSSGGG